MSRMIGRSVQAVSRLSSLSTSVAKSHTMPVRYIGGPPPWTVRHEDRYTKVRNLLTAGALIGIVGLTFYQTSRQVRSKDIFKDDEHVPGLVNELKKEEFLKEEREQAQARASAAVNNTAAKK